MVGEGLGFSGNHTGVGATAEMGDPLLVECCRSGGYLGRRRCGNDHRLCES